MKPDTAETFNVSRLQPDSIKSGYLFAALAVLLLFSALSAQGGPPTVQVCGGGQTACLTDSILNLCVTITVEADYPETIDSFFLDWGDGSDPMFIPGSNTTFDENYTYDFSSFFNSCTYEDRTTFVEIETYIASSAEPINNSFRLTVRNPPRASFSNFPTTVCRGEEVCFGQNTCPSDNLTVTYDFGDGSGPVADNCITYLETGTYTVTLTAANPCDTDQAVRTLTVIDQPEVTSAVDSGAITGQAMPFRLCIDAGARDTIRLTGAGSTGIDTYRWTVSPSSGVSILNNNQQVTQAVFTQPNTYLFTLTGRNNNCDLVATDTFSVEVVPGTTLSLTPQPDECISLQYTPTPFNAAATYSINNVVIANADFPVTLGPDTYAVSATLVNPICGNASLPDTFTVSQEATAQILSPDTVLCTLDPPLSLSAGAVMASWFINEQPFNGIFDPGSRAPGTYTIRYGNEPCILSDMITIELIEGEISITQDPVNLCVDGAATDLSAFVSPPGGTFSGSVVTPGGMFDPVAAGTGTYTIYYDFANSSLPRCGGRDSFTVTVAQLAVDFMIDDCDGNSVTFSTSAATSAFTSILWSFGGTGTSTNPNPTHTFPMAGTYAISATISTADCSVTNTREITIEEAPQAAFALNFDPLRCSPLDVSFTNNSRGGGLSYQWFANGTLFSTDPNPPLQTFTASGMDSTVVITLELSNDCSTDFFSQTVIVRPKPLPVFGVNRPRYCSLDTIRPSNTSLGTPDQYEWFRDGVLISSDSTPPQIIPFTTVADTTELCLRAVNACGDSTVCLLIPLVPTNVMAEFNLPADVCVGDSFQIINNADPGLPLYYDFGDGNGTNVANPWYAYSQPGTYVVRQQVFGCGSDVEEMEITASLGPSANWINPQFGCPGDSLLFTNTSLRAMQYLWDFGDGTTTSAEQSPVHVFSAPGTYEVCLTASATVPNTCSTTRCFNVVINTPPPTGFTFTDSICVGDQVIINSTVNPLLVCSYQFGNGNLSADCNSVTSYALPGSYPITQTVTDDNGCQASLSQLVLVRALPEPAFTFMVMDACNPDAVSFTNLTPLADGYSWDFGDGSTSMSTSPTHTYAEAGTYLVTLTARTAGLCSATFQQSVTINEMPTAIVEADGAEVCLGDSIRLVNQSTGSVSSVRWDFGDGTVSFTNSPTHTYSAEGDYTVTLTVFNEELCSDSTTFLVRVNPPVMANFANQTNVLCYSSSTGSLTITTSSGTAPFSYSWSNGGVTPQINDLTAGTYSLLIRDANACEFTTSAAITEPERIDPAATVTTVSCAGGNDGTIAVNTVGGVAPYVLSWPGGNTQNIITNLSTGNYPLTITDANACTVERTIFVPENQPMVLSDSVRQISCFGENDGIYGINEINGGIPPYQTMLTGDNYQQIGDDNTRFDGLTPGFYSFEATDSLGCVEGFELEIIEPDQVTVNIIPDTIFIGLGQVVSIPLRFNAEEPTFEWLPAIGLDCYNCEEPQASPEFDQAYNLTITDQRGCSATDSVFIKVEITRDVQLPTAFTPNLDGRNDIFRVRSLAEDEIETVEYFEIRDRWGALVFRQENFPPNDRQYGWDGTFRGQSVVIGDYAYQVKVRFVDQKTKTINGTVRVLR